MTQHLHVVDTHSNDLPTNMQAPCDVPTASEREPVRQRPSPPLPRSTSGTFWHPKPPKNA